jgi:hypothetical protein
MDETTPPNPWNEKYFITKLPEEQVERVFVNPTEEQLKLYAGYKEFVPSEQPDPTTYNSETQYPSAIYSDSDVITNTWELKDLIQGEPL